MPWFLTPHGPHFVVEPGTVDEYERRDYVVMTAQQVTDYYAGVAFPDPPSFATEAEVLPLVTAAVQSGAGALLAALRAALVARNPVIADVVLDADGNWLSWTEAGVEHSATYDPATGNIATLTVAGITRTYTFDANDNLIGAT